MRLPELKILPLEDIILHEDFSPERTAQLAKRIEEDGILKNPVIVARIKGIGKYMVIDGATRTTALKKLEFRDILTQVVNYYSDEITLDTWHHLVPARGNKEFFKRISPQLGITTAYTHLQNAEHLLRRREILCYFLFFDNTCLVMKDESGKPSEKVKKLRELVYACEELGKISRIHFSDLGESLKKNGNVYMANIFPSFGKEELIRFAQSGLRLPAGITRHIVPGRVLGFEMKTSILKTTRLSLHRKNEILQKMYEKKTLEKGIRYYPESVYVFNE